MRYAAINGSKKEQKQKMGKIPYIIQHIIQAKKSLAALDKRFSSEDSMVRGMRYADGSKAG